MKTVDPAQIESPSKTGSEQHTWSYNSPRLYSQLTALAWTHPDISPHHQDHRCPTRTGSAMWTGGEATAAAALYCTGLCIGPDTSFESQI